MRIGEGGPDVCPLSHAASRHGAGSVLRKAGACWARKGPWHLRERLGGTGPRCPGERVGGAPTPRGASGWEGPDALGSVRVGGVLVPWGASGWEGPFTFYFPALEKEMATHSSVLAWRIPGTGEPGGLPSMGSHRVGHD